MQELSWTQRKRQTHEAQNFSPHPQPHQPLLLFPEHAKQGADLCTLPSFLPPGVASPRWWFLSTCCQWCPNEALCMPSCTLRLPAPYPFPSFMFYKLLHQGADIAQVLLICFLLSGSLLPLMHRKNRNAHGLFSLCLLNARLVPAT